ncbi:putative secreted protein [Ceratocystis fimbriata CBS 114723]|uniref:Putative secreted protein n=1 Tax=Ceratocystis fimbriata CBS 114723 TaxID=1035309 RepID=A0A2C5X8W2_9PEZI|nr:putative secreted protein [Ceratocystis fimbriata CBS 114723]
MRLFSFFSLLLLANIVASAPIPEPAPVPAVGGIPSISLARSQLSNLAVKAMKAVDKYKRSKFNHWIDISGTCNTREVVLKRDGQKVVYDEECRPISGLWTSPYDGRTWDDPRSIQIDHLVPLKNAWVSGAWEWTESMREAFANDLTRPQLWAVTGMVNNDKGDSSPDKWKPPLTSAYCSYAKSWITVKSYYGLSVTPSEKAALEKMLEYC